jgi:hypothetical protein
MEGRRYAAGTAMPPIWPEQAGKTLTSPGGAPARLKSGGSQPPPGQIYALPSFGSICCFCCTFGWVAADNGGGIIWPDSAASA